MSLTLARINRLVSRSSTSYRRYLEITEFPLGLCLGADNIVGGFGEGVVVGRLSCESHGSKSVVCAVVGIVGDEANKVLFSLRQVVWDVQ